MDGSICLALNVKRCTFSVIAFKSFAGDILHFGCLV